MNGMKMPANPKLIWTTAQCNFCPRTDVRSCVIKSDVLSKLCAALHVDNYAISDANSICTCCFADLDMIIRADAIRSAMLNYYQGTMRWRPPKSNSSLDTTIQDVIPLSLQASPAKPTTVLPPNSIDLSSVSSQSKMVNNLYFKCLICDKISASKSHCMEHLVRHSNSRPFTCLSCGKTYKSRKACREHIMVIHKLSRHQEVEINEKIKVDAVVYQQMKSICSQYEQLYVPEESSSRARQTRSLENINTQTQSITQIKEEARTDSPEIIDIPDLPTDAHSPTTSSSTPSIPAMPLLIKRPSPSFDAPLLPLNENREGSVTPPSSKRGRKGIPQKVSQPEVEEEEVAVEMFCDNIPAFPEPFLKPSTSPILGNTADSNGFPRPRSKTIPPCEICGRQFVTKEKRIDHLRSHSQLKQFSCRVCKRYFKYRRGVTNHLKEVHKYTDRMKISSNVVSHENDDRGDKPENGRQTGSPSLFNQFSMGLSPGCAAVSPSGTTESAGGDSGGEILVDQDYSGAEGEPIEDINSMDIVSLSIDDGMDSANHICMECGEVCDTATELSHHTQTHK